MAQWRIPKNLPTLVNVWQNRLDYFTKRPEQWDWFVKWLDDPDARFNGYEDQKWDILYAFGHPRIRVPGRKPLRPPPTLVNDVKELTGMPRGVQDDSKDQHIQRLKRIIEDYRLNRRTSPAYNELVRKYNDLQSAMTRINTSKMETSCKKLEDVVERQQAEIASLRKQLAILTDAPPPPVVTPQQAQDAIQEQKKEVTTVVTEVQNIPAPPPPPPPPMTAMPRKVPTVRRTAPEEAPSSGLQDVLEQKMRGRRQVIDPLEDGDDAVEPDEWDEQGCRVCGQLTDLTCSQCQSVRYCSTACQAVDWDHHSMWC